MDSTTGPTGVPDPNNPGYDTGGYPLNIGLYPGGPTGYPTTPGQPPPGTPPGTPPAPPGAVNAPTAGQDPTVTAPATTPPPPTAGNGGLITPFTEAAPIFQPPPTFTAPTLDQAQKDPGYQFQLQQGEQALQNSAAAGGVLNTGGTLKDILGYGQGLATTRYNDLFNRNLTAYNTAYNAAKDTYGSQYQTWLQDYNAYRNRYLDSASAGNSTTA